MNKRKITEYTTEVVLSFYDDGSQECNVHSRGMVGLQSDDLIRKACEECRAEILHAVSHHNKGGLT